jgi:undecaprenyl diphosphate synthase
LPEEKSVNAKIPTHVAIIMDGNGRWAKKRFLPRYMGHTQGVNNVHSIVDAAFHFGVRYLTLFAFSAENWNRPKAEIDKLMKLLESFLDSQRMEIIEKQIHLTSIGDISALPASVRERLAKLDDETRQFTEHVLILALNYGSRQEIVAATKAYAGAVARGAELPDELTWDRLAKYLYTNNIPDPDLVIRTSGEERVSNFLLLQSAYAEYVFCEKYWPDFKADDLKAAMDEYSTRERRFGMTGEQLADKSNNQNAYNK